MSTEAPATYTPRLGEVAKDTRLHVLGRVMGHEGGLWQFRPLAGGREWDVKPEHIAQASPDEVLRAKTALANRMSRGEVL